MEEKFKVGVITATHGLLGEVKVFPTTDDPNRFKILKEIMLETASAETRTLEIESVKFSKQLVILKFKGLDRIEDVERYRKGELFIPRDKAVKLKKDEYFIADLIGLTVENEDGSLLGTLTDVLSTSANDVYDITMEDGRQLLLPAIRECILSVDVEQGKMTVNVLDGLMD